MSNGEPLRQSGWTTEVGWREQQRAAHYYAAYAAAGKDELIGLLLALFLGAFGAHHFYLRRTGLGILYLLFFWTGITALVSLIECLFMPARVRRYNWELSQYLLASIPAAHPTSFPSAPAPRRLALP